ncbi:MAG: carboxylesterase family protein [Deltaproteobacteria bacterium]|nr:MAG: carboxylesterase family protein [Deltaproteobacteria bacterium]
MNVVSTSVFRCIIGCFGILFFSWSVNVGCGSAPSSETTNEVSSVDAGATNEQERPDSFQSTEGSNGDRSVSPDSSNPQGSSAVVSTVSGPVRGKAEGDVRSFLGIPYAAPPVGALRWKAPVAPEPWSEPRDATQFSNICPQQDTGLPAIPGTQSEDCLYINVWTPDPAPKKAPVMVWIHGGAFVVNTASNDAFNGANMARASGVIVVSMNYRLGVPGFLLHPSLGANAGNYGLLDQVAALKWVKSNIEAFGGDPSNVTLFGLSAGGSSICIHTVAPESKGLFHRAIMQSGPCNAAPKDVAEAQGKSLAKALGCDETADVAACLRGKSVKELNNALPLRQGLLLGAGVNWGPVVDAALLADDPHKLLQEGKANKVPVILGSSRNEGTFFVYGANQVNMTETQYQDAIKAAYGAKADQILAQYPIANYNSPAAAYAELLGDSFFVCSIRRTARLLSAAGNQTYLYHFTHAPSFVPIPFLGAFHGSETGYVFGNPPRGNFETKDATLSKTLQTYWTRFAKDGVPSADDAATWPTYDAAGDKHLELDLTIKPGSGLKREKCDFWDKL